MSERPPSAGNTEFKRWAERLNDYLVRNKSKLSYYLAGQSAHDDGVLLWDRDNSRVIVSSNGSWVPLAGGGGSITNYLRDDADDSTEFRLTMGGLTVDTDTLYVDSVNNEVGIGTTDPSEKLEVVGNVEATEFIGDLRGAVVFKAQAGEALTKGDVVYISGISGNTTVVSKADADDAAKMPAFGLAAKTVSINAALEVYTFGTLSGLDTSSYTEGDELFVSTTAGALTSTAPTGESSQIQKMGKVTRSHASAGTIKIMGAGRSNATSNLNDGNIFIGDANNQTTTVSLSSKISALETSHGDVVQDGDFTSEGLMKRGATDGSYSIVTDNSSNWNTAHGWGNHASAGYLTAHQDISGKADLSGATFTGDVSVSAANRFEVGENHNVTGTRGVVGGYENTVSGNNNLVVGQQNNINGGFSCVFGYDNDMSSTGGYSLVGGTLSQTNGQHSIAIGYSCKAGQSDRWYSTALGYDSEALGTAAFAGGRSVWHGASYKTMAEADGSFAYGGGPRVYENAPNSVALGTITQCGESSPTGGITAAQSMAIGYATKAYKDNSFAGGNTSYSFGDTSFSFGNGAVASNGFSNIALGHGITTPVSSGSATTIGAVSVGQFNEYNVTTEQHFSVGVGTTDGSRYTSMYIGPRSSTDSGIVMKALKESQAHASDYHAGLAGVPVGGIYRTSTGYVKVRLT